tara:strand:- start:2387 stop:2575 length:189 start_codon:yes stop_codon:yes gene_type:complete
MDKRLTVIERVPETAVVVVVFHGRSPHRSKKTDGCAVLVRNGNIRGVTVVIAICVPTWLFDF